MRTLRLCVRNIANTCALKLNYILNGINCRILKKSDFGLRTSIFGLPSSDFCLPSSDFQPLNTSIRKFFPVAV